MMENKEEEKWGKEGEKKKVEEIFIQLVIELIFPMKESDLILISLFYFIFL